MSKENLFVMIIDVASLIAILVGFFVEEDVRAYIMLGILISGFIGYHIVSVLLLKKKRKEERRSVEIRDSILEPEVIERSSLLDGGIYSAECPKCGKIQTFGTIKRNCGSVSKCDECGQLIGWFEIYNAKNWQTTACSSMEEYI